MPQVDTAGSTTNSSVILPLNTQSSQTSLLSSRRANDNGKSDDADGVPLNQDPILHPPVEQSVRDRSPVSVSVELTKEEEDSAVENAVVDKSAEGSSSNPTTINPSLSAKFLCHNTVPDGQIFPPGAEFVKSWRMLNDGAQDWPEMTEVVFAAGDSLTRDDIEPVRLQVGIVAAGSEVNVWTGELKVSRARFDVPLYCTDNARRRLTRLANM
jgi:hypothetical protein